MSALCWKIELTWTDFWCIPSKSETVNLDKCERLNKRHPVCARCASSVQPVYMYVVCRYVHTKCINVCVTVGRYVHLPAQWHCWFVLYTSWPFLCSSFLSCLTYSYSFEGKSNYTCVVENCNFDIESDVRNGNKRYLYAVYHGAERARLYSDNSTGWTTEKSWFDSRQG
jgi:hypothetical protein